MNKIIATKNQKIRKTKGLITYHFDSDLWLDYTDIIVRIEAEISALRWCIYEIKNREKDKIIKQALTFNLIKRGADFLDFKHRACDFMKVGEN